MWIKFTTHVHTVLRLNPASISGEIPAVHFHHIIAGPADFATQVVRYKQMLKSSVEKSHAMRNFAISPDMLLRFRQKLRHSRLGRRFFAFWAALVVGFKLLLMGIFD